MLSSGPKFRNDLLFGQMSQRVEVTPVVFGMLFFPRISFSFVVIAFGLSSIPFKTINMT